MFTGIITHVGRIRSIDKQPDGDTRLTIETDLPGSAMTNGASIACQGVCLTVVEQGDDWFSVQASQETLDKTTLGQWRIDDPVNLEASLKIGDELGGHLVFGHVDTTTEITVIEPVEDSHLLRFALPGELAPMIAPKGSITIDGISLTVNAVTGDDFTVNIIPYTWDHTTLGRREIGDKVNIEIDMLARYAARAREFV
jgi:riboflavin synthase